jgi:hypothetical protein
VLDVFLQIAVVLLQITADFLNCSTILKIGITDGVSGGLLDLSLRLFNATLDLILVHDNSC